MSGKAIAAMAAVMALLTAAAAGVFFSMLKPSDEAEEAAHRAFPSHAPGESAAALEPPPPPAPAAEPERAAQRPASSLGFVRSDPGFQEEEKKPETALAAAAEEGRRNVGGLRREQRPRPVAPPPKTKRRSRPTLKPMDGSGFRSLEREKAQDDPPLDQFKQYLK